MVEWLKTEGLVDYNIAVSFMESRASEIAANKNKELVWLLEHPPFIPLVLQPMKTTFWIKTAFLFIVQGAVVSLLITGQAKGLLT